MSNAAIEKLYEEEFQIDLTAARFDEANGLVKGVRILGQNSKNGRFYTDECMHDAQKRKLYEGVEVFTDHLRESEMPDGFPRDRMERGLLEGVGFLLHQQITREADGLAIRCDWQYLKEHQGSKLLIERAKRFPDKLGFSHHAEGAVREDNGKLFIDRIDHVESVDIVRRPATNKNLFESETRTMAEQKPVTKKLKEMLATAGLINDHRFANIKKLAEEMPVMADAPVAVSSDSSPDAQFKAAIGAMVMAVIGDDKLDKPEKKSRIGKILDTEEKLMNTETKNSSGAGEGDKKVSEELQQLRLKDSKRDLLEEYGWNRAQLAAETRQQLDESKTIEAAKSLVESLGAPPTNRQASGSYAPPKQYAPGSGTYDQLRESVVPRKR